MKTPEFNAESARQDRTPPRRRQRDGRAGLAQACEHRPLCCPICGRPLSDAAETAQKHERFLKRLFERQEEFERGIASAIHDDLAQQLAGALLHFERCGPLQEGPADDAQNGFRIGVELLRDSLRQARRIAGQLRPLTCDDHGITPEIEYLIHEMVRRSGAKIVFRVKGKVDRLPLEFQSAVFRILRELLTNACCHSASELIRLQVARTKAHLRLVIEDWGTGFDPANVNGTAFGLREVRQRARLLGGEVTIRSKPGQGTRVVVDLPVDDIPHVASRCQECFT